MQPKLINIISRESPIAAPPTYGQFDDEFRQFQQYAHLKGVRLALLDEYKSLFAIPTHLGQEVEVENIHSTLPLPGMWSVKPDNSLRQGAEFYTTVPLSVPNSMKASLLLWAALKELLPQAPSFGWRVSTQIHISVLDLTEEEFKSLLLLILLFEGVFFTIAGVDRMNSNFCVPLLQWSDISNIRAYFQRKTTLKSFATHWPKYTAVNLCRMFPFGQAPALGSVEFRHLGGIENVKDILLWQAMAVQLFQAAVQYPREELTKDIISLNDSEKYLSFMKRIMPMARPKIPNLKGVMGPAVSRIKSILADPPRKVFQITNSSLVAKIAAKVYLAQQKNKKPRKRVIKKTIQFDEFNTFASTLASTWVTTAGGTGDGGISWTNQFNQSDPEGG